MLIVYSRWNSVRAAYWCIVHNWYRNV